MLRIAVPDLHSYDPLTGIGRVLHGLLEGLDQRAVAQNATYRRMPLPIVRNFPYGFEGTNRDTDVILLPKLVGTSALHRRLPFKTIAMCHDLGIIDSAGDLQYFNPLSRYIIRRDLSHLTHADGVMVPSQFTKERLLEYMPNLAGRITVATPGVSDDFFRTQVNKCQARQNIKRLIGRTVTGPLLLYVGTERPRKNIGLLFKVVRLLKENYPDMTLIKIGAAGLEEFRHDSRIVQEQTGLVSGKDIIWIESMTDEDLRQVYVASDVYVSGSLYEGFGLPYIESLAVGLPVVAVQTGILDSSIPGVFIAKNDPSDFAAQVHRAITEGIPPLDTMRNYVRNRFTWKQYADTFLSMVDAM